MTTVEALEEIDHVRERLLELVVELRKKPKKKDYDGLCKTLVAYFESEAESLGMLHTVIVANTVEKNGR